MQDIEAALHALLREAGLTSRPISSIQIGFVLAPRINAAGRMGRAELAAELLLTDDPVRAEKLARELCELNRERQSVEQDIFRRAIEQMEDIELRHLMHAVNHNIISLPERTCAVINALYNSRNQLAHHRILPYSELKQLHQQLL